MCLACLAFGRDRLCRDCRSGLCPGGIRRLGSGLVVGSGLLHEGVARTLVHRLKYQGIRQAAVLLAPFMAAALNRRAGGLVPIPRVLARTWKHAIDPARELANTLGSWTGLPVVDVLTVPVWEPAQAGLQRASRTAPQFKVHSIPPGPLILVDDVLTTGTTLGAAHRAIGRAVMFGVTATAAGRVVM